MTTLCTEDSQEGMDLIKRETARRGISMLTHKMVRFDGCIWVIERKKEAPKDGAPD